MSEADSLNHDAGLPESVDPSDPSAPIVDSEMPTPSGNHPDTEGWQTVDFPGAISVDAIPHSAATPSTPTVDPAIGPAAEVHSQVRSETEDLAALVQQLRQQTAGLQTQVADLEKDLAQKQIELQLETARNLHGDSEAIAQATAQAVKAAQDLTSTQEKMGRLFQELELSHQTAQRQQILVETLTEQLAGSQERIAQLERECAVTQQRFNEQVQQRLQAETACRDLRMRLHRQQQQTLQFKAALERSLEMATPYRQNYGYSNAEVADTATVSSPAPSPGHSGDPNFVLRNQPVRPWADIQRRSRPQAEAEEFGSPLANPLTRLVQVDADQPDATAETESPTVPPLVSEQSETNPALETHSSFPESEDPQRLGDLLNLMFPETPAPSDDSIEETPPSPIFDLSPFFAAESAPDESMSDAPAATGTDAAIAPPSGPTSQATEAPTLNQAALWDDLEKLIEPAPLAIPVNSLVEDADHPTSIVPPAQVTAVTAQVPLPSEADPESITTHSGLNAQSTSQTALDLLNFGTSGSASKGTVSTSVNTPLFSSNWPSPVLYPMRPSKKRQSLAAVELPTFPRPK